jgi:hypothetical protein
MLFERWILSWYDLYNVIHNGHKYIHSDFIVDCEYNMLIFLTIGFALVNNFSLHLNVGTYIKITNFREMFKNRFERLDVCLEGGLE